MCELTPKEMEPLCQSSVKSVGKSSVRRARQGSCSVSFKTKFKISQFHLVICQFTMTVSNFKLKEICNSPFRLFESLQELEGDLVVFMGDFCKLYDDVSLQYLGSEKEKYMQSSQAL